jgi:hypothetical protein
MKEEEEEVEDRSGLIGSRRGCQSKCGPKMVSHGEAQET